jgi:hypothetical protein
MNANRTPRFSGPVFVVGHARRQACERVPAEPTMLRLNSQVLAVCVRCRAPPAPEGSPEAPCFTSVSPMRTLIVTLGLCMALQPPPKRAAAVPNNLVCGTATRRAPAVPLPAKVLTPEQRVAIGIEH